MTTKLISIIPADEEILRKSLKSSHRDFEDAIQISVHIKSKK